MVTDARLSTPAPSVHTTVAFIETRSLTVPVSSQISSGTAGRTNDNRRRSYSPVSWLPSTIAAPLPNAGGLPPGGLLVSIPRSSPVSATKNVSASLFVERPCQIPPGEAFTTGAGGFAGGFAGG